MNLLSIGGSDPSSGAGIQSDIMVFSSLGAHCLTVVTAVTSQNTTSFGRAEPVSRRILKGQLESVMSDFKIGGIKIGMVYDSQVIRAIHRRLEGSRVPIVVDPVLKSTTGGSLIKNSAVRDFEKLIVPLATVITPNRFEAEILAKAKIDAENPPEKVAKIIQMMGAKNVAITGVEEKGGRISDFVLEKNSMHVIWGSAVPGINHGSGCSYSAAMVFALGKKKGVLESARFAKRFARDSIKNAEKRGKGIVITGVHGDSTSSDLSDAIDKFARIKNIYRNIPECQTNFVSSGQRPKSTDDILGISGRIVKTGRRVAVAGDLRYGGSKHVATALLAVSKKFPEVCSAINIKYQDSTISKIKRSKLAFSSYDRSAEPAGKAGHSSIEWGTRRAIGSLSSAPDVIFHAGDFGKEPMIMVFGKTPDSVVKKVVAIV